MQRALVCLLLAGCVAPQTRPTVTKQLVMKPGQDYAIGLVWGAFGGTEAGRLPPMVEWYEGAQLDCVPEQSFWTWGPGFGVAQRQCVFGEYIPAMHLAIVAWRGGRISATSFVHELCHAWYGDPDHEVCKRSDQPGIVGALSDMLFTVGM